MKSINLNKPRNRLRRSSVKKRKLRLRDFVLKRRNA